jgi:hypothetical protein
MGAGVWLGLSLLGVVLAASVAAGLLPPFPARDDAASEREAWVVGPDPHAPSSPHLAWKLVLLAGPSAVLDFADGRIVTMGPGAALYVDAGAEPRLRERAGGQERLWLSIHPGAERDGSLSGVLPWGAGSGGPVD